MSKKYLFIAACPLLAGCVDEISADLPPAPKALVVNSVITPDSVFRVQVGRVVGTTDSSSRLVSTAEVYLQQPGQPAELLRNQGRGLYFVPRRPVSGVPYTLRVQAAGYPAAEATDTVPELVPIRELWYAYPTGTDRNNQLLGTIVVRFADPPATRNYYEIVAYQQQARNRSQDLTLDVRGNAALAAEGDAEFMPETLVFSDQLFDGQSFELRAVFAPSGFGTTSGVPHILGDLHVVLRSVSRSYYQYRKSWTRHLYNQGVKGSVGNLSQMLFVGDPTRMYTNVRGGYGVVVAHAQHNKIAPRR